MEFIFIWAIIGCWVYFRGNIFKPFVKLSLSFDIRRNFLHLFCFDFESHFKKSISQDKRQKILNKHGRSWEFLEGGSKSSKMSSLWLADEESLRLENSLKSKFRTLLNEVSSTLSCLFSDDSFSYKVLRTYIVTNVLFVKRVLSIPCIHYKLIKLNLTFVQYFCWADGGSN